MEFFWDRKFLQFYFRNALEGKGSFASVGKVILPLNSWIPLRISGTRLPDNLHTGKKKKEKNPLHLQKFSTSFTPHSRAIRFTRLVVTGISKFRLGSP